MRHILTSLIIIVGLTSCTTGTINISDLPDLFTSSKSNVLNVDWSMNDEGNKLEDNTLVQGLMKLAEPDMDYGSELANYNLQLVNKYSLGSLIGFTAQFGEDCSLTLYYFSIDNSGSIISATTVARETDCGDYTDEESAIILGDSALISTRKESDPYSITPIITEKYITQESGKLSIEEKSLIQSVCLWEKISVRNTPEEKGKYLTSITLGEKVLELGEKVKDESSEDQHFYTKVRLSDNSEGWVQERFLGQNASPLAVYEKSIIYQRADELTETEYSFEKTDVVAIIEQSGHPFDGNAWYKVRGKPSGENWFKEGWIKESGVSFWVEEVAFAALLKQALADNDKDKIRDLIDNEKWQSTKLADFARELVGESISIRPGFASFLEGIPKLSLPLVITDSDTQKTELSEEDMINWFGGAAAFLTEGVGYFTIGDKIVFIKSTWFMGSTMYDAILFDSNGNQLDELTIFQKVFDGGVYVTYCRIDEDGILIESNNTIEEDGGEQESSYSIYQIVGETFEEKISEEVNREDLTLFSSEGN